MGKVVVRTVRRGCDSYQWPGSRPESHDWNLAERLFGFKDPAHLSGSPTRSGRRPGRVQALTHALLAEAAVDPVGDGAVGADEERLRQRDAETECLRDGQVLIETQRPPCPFLARESPCVGGDRIRAEPDDVGRATLRDAGDHHDGDAGEDPSSSRRARAAHFVTVRVACMPWAEWVPIVQ